MKKSLLLTALTISLLGSAQQMEQTTEPSINEISSLFLCDSFAVDYSNITGSGVTWNYANIGGYSGGTRDIEIVNPATTSHAAEFPASTVALIFADKITTYYTSTALDKTSQGFVFTEQTMGDIIAKFNLDEQIVATYPFAFGNSVSDDFAGNLIYNGGASTSSATGNGVAEIDGIGTLQVGASSVSNVLRYKLVDTSYASVQIFPPPLPATNIVFVRNQYEYYDYATTNMPVFVHSTISMSNVGAPAPISEETIVLSAYPPSGEVGIEQLNSVEFKMYPNPASNELMIDGIDKDASIEILDQTGRVLINGLSGSQKIDINRLETGVYMVRVKMNESASMKSFMKK